MSKYPDTQMLKFKRALQTSKEMDEEDETFAQQSQGFASPVSQRPPRTPIASTPFSQQSNASGGLGGAGGARFGQYSQGTPIRGAMHPPPLPRGDLGRTPSRTPARAPGHSRFVPSTPMDEGDIFSGITATPQGPQAPLDDGEDDDFDEPLPVDGARLATQIWGTEINVANCLEVFRSFLRYFGAAGGGLSVYYSEFLRMATQGIRILELDIEHLKAFAVSRQFAEQLVQYPQEIIPLVDVVANEEYLEANRRHNPEYAANAGPGDDEPIQTRPCHLTKRSRLRDLNPEQIEHMISIRGMVIRVSPIIPDLKVAFFRCFTCGMVVDAAVDRGKIEEPPACARCNGAGTMEVIHNRCTFADKQLIKLQETPDEIPPGETPYTVTLFAFDDLVDTVRPGDRIEVTGIYRAVIRRTNARQRNVASVFRTYIDSVHFQPLHSTGTDKEVPDDDSGMDTVPLPSTVPSAGPSTGPSITGTANDVPTFSAQQIHSFQTFAANDVYTKLLDLFAPSVYGLDDAKRGLLCLLFGGTVHTQGGVHLRGDLNVLLCGDPGTSKSQLLGYVHRLASRGIYTSGKGSSAVGLTASVVRDQETKEMVLESGALVLSDQGICCIDEFDKMSDSTRAILHEAMEQQTVSITKAGIIATLHARTSILASANPAQSRYNPKLSVLENIQLPPTLISRFDLIYLVLDTANPEEDRRLAKHLLSLYAQDHVPVVSSADGQSFLRDYILYAKHNVFPELSEEAGPVLEEAYLSMRALGNAHYASSGVPTAGLVGRRQAHITATPRQLESLIRLAQALAKMRLSSIVTPDDVHEAVRLMKVATQTAAIDPRTGTLDMDLLATGRSGMDRDLTAALAERVFSALQDRPHGGRITVGQIRQMLLQQQAGQGQQQGLSMGQVEAAAKELHANGLLQYQETTQTCILRPQ